MIIDTGANKNTGKEGGVIRGGGVIRRVCQTIAVGRASQAVYISSPWS